MASNNDKSTDKPADKLPTAKPAPPVIDTAKLLGVENDPRGDNRPGVITDQPAESGINPVTNLPESETNDDGVTARIPSQSAEPINAPENGKAKPADAPAPKGRKLSMVLDRDYWPRTRPPGMDPDAEYRIRAGETVDLPSEEAMDVMEMGVGKRADRRA